ncbi:MAG: ATP-binding protein [Deltaproteobacteria bacterium]|nr:ATP-binding protein [Deltaproteobacteria bacterium]
MSKRKTQESVLKKLPLTDESFREIIQGNYLYADKTKYIHTMIGKYKCCFLSRPRRFGKTLLLKTVEELFRGNRELFKGLWIGSKSDYAFDIHPVLRFNMAYAEIYSGNDLVDRIKRELSKAAKLEGVTISANSFDEMLYELLYGLHKMHGVGSVVLIDEYDAPVTRHISDMRLASACRDVLHDFYTALKTNIDYIRFSLVTGITRFAMTSMDSGPNNFKDISLLPEFAGICGFTTGDLELLFKDRFKETLDSLKLNREIAWNAKSEGLKAKILQWYDGYNWLGKKHVLNPYSILNFFDEKQFASYWPLSGQPSHLSALVKANPLEYIQPRLISYTAKEIRKSELATLKAVPVLFHSGYLTIDSVAFEKAGSKENATPEKKYTFRIPNAEVDQDFVAMFFKDAFEPDYEYLSDLTDNLPNALLDKDHIEVVRLFHNLLSSISSEQHAASEQLYHAVLHGSLLAAGFEVQSQGSGARGRSDIALSLNDKIRVVMELKYCNRNMSTGKLAKTGTSRAEKERAEKSLSDRQLSAALNKGEKAIREKDYAAPYRAARCEVICLALAIRGRDEVAARFIEP